MTRPPAVVSESSMSSCTDVAPAIEVPGSCPDVTADPEPRPRLRRFRGRRVDELWAWCSVPRSGCIPVAVTSATGGSGKSTIASTLGLTLAAASNGRVAGVDLADGLVSSLRRRTLAEPSGLTIDELLAWDPHLSAAADLDTVVGRAATGLHVYTTGNDLPDIRGTDIDGIAMTLPRWYAAAMLDLPRLPDPICSRVLARGVELVLTTRADRASIEATAAAIEFLHRTGFAAVASRAVLVVVATQRRTPRDVPAALRLVQRRFRRVIRMPHDPAMTTAEPIDLDRLKSASAAVLTELALAVTARNEEA